MRTKDPRVEPVSLPPGAAPDESTPDVPNVEARAVEIIAPREERPEPKAARVVTNTDPRLESIEPFLRRGDWAGIVKELGPPEKAGALPPQLGLIFALAMNESAGADSPTDAAQLAIRCAAGLLGVEPESATALILAKRLLRKNPLSFGKRAAPPARVSVLIVFVTLVIGGGVGWLLTGGGSILSLFR